MARNKSQSAAYKAVHPQFGFVRSLNRPRTKDNVPIASDTPLDIGRIFIRHKRDHTVSMDGSGHIYTDSGELLL